MLQSLRRIRFAIGIGVVLIGCAHSRPAAGHEHWLMPSTYRPQPGDTLQVTAWVGTGFQGEAKTWSPARCAGFMVVERVSRSLAGVAVEADPVWARIPAGAVRGFLIAYVSNFIVLEQPGVEFTRYLELEGLTESLEERRRAGESAAPGRERYRRCSKLWAGEGGAEWSRVLGQPLEIVPLSNPSRPGVLHLRVLADGAPAPRRLVRAWRQPLRANGQPISPETRGPVSPTTEAWTDEKGEVRLDLKEPGEWLVSVVRMVRSTHRSAEWESSWASFAFARH